MKISAILLFAVVCLGALPCHAQEWPYFVTYSHDLEEPDNLEVALKTTQATPKFGNFFSGATLELEYGARGWWTTELYLSGQHTSNDSTVFTGFRWENRFRPLLHDHFINPVLYFEYENLNRADRSLLEVEQRGPGCAGGLPDLSDRRLRRRVGRWVFSASFAVPWRTLRSRSLTAKDEKETAKFAKEGVLNSQILGICFPPARRLHI
jgi:hypothetical protein